MDSAAYITAINFSLPLNFSFLNSSQPIPVLLLLADEVPQDFLWPFLAFWSALCAWTLLAHTLWLQLHPPMVPLSKCPRDTAIVNCSSCLRQGAVLQGQTPYWTGTRQRRKSTLASADDLKIKGGLLQRGFSVHSWRSKTCKWVLQDVQEFGVAQTLKWQGSNYFGWAIFQSLCLNDFTFSSIGWWISQNETKIYKRNFHDRKTQYILMWSNAKWRIYLQEETDVAKWLVLQTDPVKLT